MSGKRQHFIPQFYQKGFLSEDHKKNYTYQYLKDGRVLSANIKNVGTEGFFYSLNGDHSVDEVITEAETEFAMVVETLRQGKADEIKSSDISKLIAHLEVRTRHIRASFQSSSLYLMGRMKETLMNKKVLMNYFMINIMASPDKLDELLTAEYERMMLPHQLRVQVKKILIENVGQWLPSISEKIVELYTPILTGFMDSKLPDAIKSGHLKELGKSIYPDFKTEKYNSLKYKVLNVDRELPLGDSLVLFEVEGERRFKPFFEKNDLLKNVYIPISRNKLLWGTVDEVNPNLDDIDLYIAECSFEFFIASVRNERLLYIQSMISKNAYIISKEEIDCILSELIADNFNV
ncbi:DUF4238 domain-containing protein [Serratia marcescens]|uniref:DUF4238 domain-containing protein n=1 Tax=Serratia marcescens TaxID=615 RepID=UPI00301D9811